MPSLYDHLIQESSHSISNPGSSIHRVEHRSALHSQIFQRLATVVETPSRFHVCHRIPLDLLITGFLLKDVDELQI